MSVARWCWALDRLGGGSSVVTRRVFSEHDTCVCTVRIAFFSPWCPSTYRFCYPE